MVDVSISDERAGSTSASSERLQNRFVKLGDYALKHLVWHLLELDDRRNVALVMLDIDYLEIKAERGWVFELIEELAAVVRSQPEPDGPLEAISGALQRNGGYIARRPTTLFQCVWNTGCWQDPDLLGPFLKDSGGDPRGANAQPSSITALLTRWRRRRAERSPGSVWVRSLRPTRADLDRNVQLVLTLAKYEDSPAVVRFSPDSAVVVIWFCKYENGHIVTGAPRAWDCGSGRIVAVPRDMHTPPPKEGRSPDGSLVATFGGPDGGWDFPVRVAGFGAPSDVREYHTEPDTHISAVAISPTNRLLAGTGYGIESGGDVYVWDLASGKVAARPDAYDPSHAVSFSADETQLAFASGSELKLCDLASGDERTIGKQDDWIRAISFSPDGRKIASISHDGTCRIYAIGSSSSGSEPVGPSDYIHELVFSPSGDRLVSRSANGTLHLWDGGAGVPVACLATSDMIRLEGSDGRRCLLITDETVRSVATLAGEWDVRTGRKLDDGESLHFGPADVNIAPDGSRLCSYDPFERDSESHRIQLFDPREGQLASFTHNAAIRCAAFTADSQLFAYGAADGRVRIRTTSTGELRCEFRAHEAAIADCTVSRDGTWLATLGVDQQLLIWRWTELLGPEPPTADRPRTIQPETRLDVRKATSADGIENQDGRLRIAFAGSDDWHVVVQAGRSFSIWDWRTRAHVRTVATTDLLDEVVAGRATHLRTSGDEVVISEALSGSPKAWFAVPIGLSSRTFVRSPTSDVWAGMTSHSILHFRLERD